MTNFDEQFDMSQLLADEKELDKNKDFEEVPFGDYEVHVSRMELKESSTKKPMVSIWFKIVEGDFKNQLIFYNQVVHTAFCLHKAKEMLRSLSEGEINFDSFEQFNELIMDIAEESQSFDYHLKYTEGNNGFADYEITEKFPTLE